MSFQLPPIGCNCCGCDPSVTINLTGGGGAIYTGTENPNDSGFIPVDPTVASDFMMLTEDGYYTGTRFTWNVEHQFWG